MTILIIEGPDLVGKSTAIEKIAKHFKQGFLLKNLYKPTKANDDEIWTQYWKMINMMDSNKDDLFILDRFYQSQMVYSVLRGPDDTYHAKALEVFLQDRDDVYYIYLTTPFTELERRYKKIGDEHINLKQLKLICKRYKDYFFNCSLHKIQIDTRDKDWIKDIESFTRLKK